MDSEYTDLLHSCFRCGWCKLPTNYVDFNCPAYLKYRFESFESSDRKALGHRRALKAIRTTGEQKTPKMPQDALC